MYVCVSGQDDEEEEDDDDEYHMQAANLAIFFSLLFSFLPDSGRCTRSHAIL